MDMRQALGHNPSEAKAAHERLKKRHEEDQAFLKARGQQQQQAAPVKSGSSLGLKIERARAKHKLKQIERDEHETRKAVASARRKGVEAQRKTEHMKKRTEAEQKLQAQKQKQTEALTETRAARRARLLSEQELRREQLRPYTEGAKRVVGGFVSAGKSAMRGLQKMQEKSDEFHRQHPDYDPMWGTFGKTQKPQRPVFDSLDLGLPRTPTPRASQPTRRQSSQLIDLGDLGLPPARKRGSDKLIDLGDFGDLLR